MKIAIIGYGKMGKEIESAAKNLGLEISKIITSHEDLLNTRFEKDEVAIEFTSRDSVLFNIEHLIIKGVKVICGTTGSDISKIKDIVLKNKGAFLFASNFSIGVNIFWKILQNSAKLIDKFEDYDVFGHEVHHKHKKDSPSGTSISTGEILIQNIKRKTELVYDKLDREIKDYELQISSNRGGYVVGEHSITFDSKVDSIKIEHSAKNRSGYAFGALKCANWIFDKTGFFTIDDYLNDVLS